MILLVCSGPLLLAGLVVQAYRPSGRWVVSTGLVLIFIVVAGLDRDSAILVLQSSALGVSLLLGSLALNWSLTRSPTLRITAASQPGSRSGDSTTNRVARDRDMPSRTEWHQSSGPEPTEARQADEPTSVRANSERTVLTTGGPSPSTVDIPPPIEINPSSSARPDGLSSESPS